MASKDIFDVAIIGAGIQGAGAAQAMAAAGYSVTVLESRTAASGTSSRSSKLIHGGLRYLETMQIKLVFESLAERATLLRIAPHLVRLVPFHIPVYRQTSRGPWTIRAGLSLYAILGGLRKDARFRTVPKAAWPLLDGLRTKDLKAVFRYYDGQTDDAALCRAVLASAKDLGAEVHMGAKVVSANRDSAGWKIAIREGHDVHDVLAKTVVNATGPWVNLLLDHVTPAPPRREVDLVGGSHVEISGHVDQGIYYAEAPEDRRAVFTIPWKGHLMVGTTEQPFDGDPREVKPTQREIDYLLETHKHYFPDWQGELLSTWSGLRVLPRGKGDAFNRPREVILEADDKHKPTFLSVYGGKLTGYRATAERIEKRLRPSLQSAKRLADTKTLTLPPDPGGEEDATGPS